MSELAVRTNEQTSVAVPQPQPQQVPSPLIKWAEEAKVISNIAASIAKTSFAGQLRNQPEEVTAVILAGHELGLKPMAALKSMDIIQGTPALRAHAMRGLVMSHGHKVQLVEYDENHCIMRGRRKDEGDDDWQTVTWTIQRATQLGLVNKAEWKKQPQTMLVARATGEICRLIASDVLHGVPYTTEELNDSAPIQLAAITQPRPALSLAALAAPPVTQERPAAVPAPEPAGFDDADDELLPHEWDIHKLAQALGMSEADLEERCYGVTGSALADISEAQHRALFQELANEMVQQDNHAGGAA